MVEVALMCPWIFFLFVGVLDFGFYNYALICTESAARAAAMATATTTQSQAAACTAAFGEMRRVVNVASLAANYTCGGTPLTVTQQTLCGSAAPTTVCPGGATGTAPADAGADTTSASSLVTVSYVGNQMIPIPGLIAGTMNVTRTAEMRIIVQ